MPRFVALLTKLLFVVALLFYVAVLGYLVFFARRRSGLVWTPDMVNLVPVVKAVHYYPIVIEGSGMWNYWTNVFGNIALFVPMPILIAGLTGWRNWRGLLAFGVATSCLIEVLQYVLRLGVADVDDIILNSIGVAVGLVLWHYVFGPVYSWLLSPTPGSVGEGR